MRSFGTKLTLLSLVAFMLASCSGRESMLERRRRMQREEVRQSREQARAVERDDAESDTSDLTELLDDPGVDDDMGSGEGDDVAFDDEDLDDDFDIDAELGIDEVVEEESPREPVGRSSRTLAGAGGVLNDLRDSLAVQREEAEHYSERGENLMQQGRIRDAAAAFRRALDLNPAMAETRAKYNQCMVLLNERDGEAAAVRDALAEQQKVLREQRIVQIERNLTRGLEARDRNDVDEALRLISLADDELALALDAGEDLRSRVRDALESVRREKNALERKRREELARSADSQSQLEIERAERRTRSEVQVLLRKSANFIRLREYDKAIQACERILELDPENRIARYWLKDSRDQQFSARRLTLIQNHITNRQLLDEAFLEARIPYDRPFVFPDEDDWADVQERSRASSTLTLDDPEPIARIKDALQQKISLILDETPLTDAIDQIRNFVGINIGIDSDAGAEDMTVTMPLQDVPAGAALNLILENVGLAYTFKENILFITTEDNATGRTEFIIYSVSDILNKIRDFVGPELILRGPNDAAGGESPISFTADTADEETAIDSEALDELIRASTGEDEWDNDVNEMEYHAGQLLVTATPELHRKIAQVLENLRKDADLFVVIEARFLDINDDFLEDIGIDSRSLGLINNFGTPFGSQINDDRTGGQDIGFVRQGSPIRDVTLVMGQDRWAGRIQHIIDGFTGTIRGERLSGNNGSSGISWQNTWLEPFQINTILRAVQERSDVRQLTAPVITAHNGQRVYVSVITQRAYIADYELVSGGTGFAIIEVADPVVQTFQEGVILDVDPVVHHDKKYITLDVRPTLATLIGGVISTIQISLGSFTNVAFQVPIGVPEIALQQSFTTVTVPNGGTVLLGGFKSMNESNYQAYLPILGQIPIIKNLFRRKATLLEKRSLVILLTARIVDLRGEERDEFSEE